MFEKMFAASLFITGCAVSQGFSTLPQEDRPTGISPSFEVRQLDETHRWFPSMVTEPKLPSAQPLRTALLSTGHERFSLAVRICVTPSGAVSHVALQQSSGVADLDRAALRDVGGWRYQPFLAPARVQTCDAVTLRYKPE